MENNQDVWPPAPASRSEQKLRQPPTSINWLAVFAGLLSGLAYYGILWRVSYRSCYPPDTSGYVTVAQLPFGLAAPLLPKFLTGLAVGLVLLLLACLPVYRRTKGFGIGLAMSIVPCILAFLFVLFLFSHMPKTP